MPERHQTEKVITALQIATALNTTLQKLDPFNTHLGDLYPWGARRTRMQNRWGLVSQPFVITLDNLEGNHGIADPKRFVGLIFANLLRLYGPTISLHDLSTKTAEQFITDANAQSKSMTTDTSIFARHVFQRSSPFTKD